jgi:hydroxyacylglutathione hydrolase
VVDPAEWPNRCWPRPDRRGWRSDPDLEHALAPRPYRRQCGDQGGDRVRRSAARRPRRRKIPTLDVEAGEGRQGPDRCDHVARGDGDVPAHTAGHIAFHLPERRCLRRRHLVRDGLRPAVRGHRRADVRQYAAELAALPDPRRSSIARTNIPSRTAATRWSPSPTMQRDRASGWSGRRGARPRGEPTVPTTIALERATNPFMRARDAAELAARRAAKDVF